MGWQGRLPDPEYRRLSLEKSRAIESLKQIIAEPARRRDEIIQGMNNISVKIFRFLRGAIAPLVVLELIVWFIAGPAWPTAIAIIYLSIFSLVNDWKSREVQKTLDANIYELRRLDTMAADAVLRIQSVTEEYDKSLCLHCDNFPSYPADWKERRQLVLHRDNFRCTSCGWPNGVHRRARELHVHHKIPLSDGGTNELSNLVTLCHICHRKVDKKHAGVRKLNRKSSKRKW